MNIIQKIFDGSGQKKTKKVVISVGAESSFYISDAGRDYLRKKLNITHYDNEYDILNDYRMQKNGRTRDDPVLVEMLKLLGEKAYTDKDCKDWKLAIVEMPVDMEYVIMTGGVYDLVEHVEEKPHKYYLKKSVT